MQNNSKDRLYAECVATAAELEDSVGPMIRTCSECAYYNDAGYCYDGNSSHTLERYSEDVACLNFEAKHRLSRYQCICDWLDEQLGIEFTVKSDGEYICGTVVTCTGGPHIEVDTRRRAVIGYWSTDEAVVSVDAAAIDTLDSTLRAMYENARCEK